MKAIYPGSFDPVTNGHIDIISRASELFESLVVAVSKNISKKYIFSVEERASMIQESVAHLSNVTVEVCDGLVADFARAQAAGVIVRGLRAVSDFDIEFKLALMNKHLNPQIETVFLVTNEKYLFLNSSLIREISSFGGNVSEFVPNAVVDKLERKYNENKENESHS